MGWDKLSLQVKVGDHEVSRALWPGYGEHVNRPRLPGSVLTQFRTGIAVLTPR